MLLSERSLWTFHQYFQGCWGFLPGLVLRVAEQLLPCLAPPRCGMCAHIGEGACSPQCAASRVSLGDVGKGPVPRAQLSWAPRAAVCAPGVNWGWGGDGCMATVATAVIWRW